MTIAEIFSKAGMNTLLGMGTVFVMLILISCIISLFRFIPEPGASKKQKEKTAKASAANGAAPVRMTVFSLRLSLLPSQRQKPPKTARRLLKKTKANILFGLLREEESKRGKPWKHI